MKISILGAGMWGRTLATLLARNGNKICLWDIREDLPSELTEFYDQMKANGHVFTAEPEYTTDIDKVLTGVELVMLVLPSSVVRKVSSDIKGKIPKGCPIVVASKGIEEGEIGFSLMVDIVTEELGDNYPIGILSGPNLSLEIQAKQPAVSLIASADSTLIGTTMKLLASDIFRVYGSTDVVGVQVGGAIKNVVAIAAGIVDELGFENNTKAALLTRGLAEITRMGIHLGGKAETFSGISGLGDLICTANSPTSRNYRAGRLFGKGKKRVHVESEIVQVVEGIDTAKSVYDLADSIEIDMPICNSVYRVVWEGRNPLDEIRELMKRNLKFE